MLGFVCFMCPGSFLGSTPIRKNFEINHPGLFNALNGLGGGGQIDTSTASNANAAVYSTFGVSAFFAGFVSLHITLFSGLTGGMYF